MPQSLLLPFLFCPSLSHVLDTRARLLCPNVPRCFLFILVHSCRRHSAPCFCSFVFKSQSGNRLLHVFHHLPQTFHFFCQGRYLCALGSCTGRALARGPGRASMIFCGPGRVRPETCGPWLVNNNVAGCGPGLGLTFPGLGRARAYNESHSCFNIMVKITLNYPLQ